MSFRSHLHTAKKSMYLSNSVRSFRLTHNEMNLLHRPDRLIVAASALMLSVISVVAMQSQSNTWVLDNSTPAQAVLGEATSVEAITRPDTDVYRASISSLLGEYLQLRFEYLANLSDESLINWSATLNSMNDATLSLVVPGSHKDAHLSLMLILTTEHELVESMRGGSESLTIDAFRELSRRYEKLLVDYPWLDQ